MGEIIFQIIFGSFGIFDNCSINYVSENRNAVKECGVDKILPLLMEFFNFNSNTLQFHFFFKLNT